MKKIFVFSITFAAILLVIGYFTAYTQIIGTIALVIALLFIGIGGVVTNNFADADQMRLHEAIESKDDRKTNHRILFISAIIGTPFFIVGVILLAI